MSRTADSPECREVRIALRISGRTLKRFARFSRRNYLSSEDAASSDLFYHQSEGFLVKSVRLNGERKNPSARGFELEKKKRHNEDPTYALTETGANDAASESERPLVIGKKNIRQTGTASNSRW